MLMNTNFIFVIPSYNPTDQLIEIATKLIGRSDTKIVVVNDGSSENTKQIFDKLLQVNDEKIDVLHHAINMGKGAALKTAFNHILVNYTKAQGCITLDSDGQHDIDDCMSVMEKLQISNSQLILGYRKFSKDIPIKSYLGNNISRLIYKLLLGRSFKDTQTGLRGLTREFMKECLSIKSNRFDFETEQLAIASNKYPKNAIQEVPIKTIYIKNNKATSFRPFIDSFNIYFVLFRYGLSSVVTTLADFIVFIISINAGLGVFASNMAARTVSIGVQFTLLNKMVFQTDAGLSKFLFFVFYVYLMGVFSSTLQLAAVNNLGLPIIISKLIIESILFILNFAFLRSFLFRKHNASNGE